MDSMNDTWVVAGPASSRTSHTHRLRGLAGTGFFATVSAMVATVLAAALAPGCWRGLRGPRRWRDDPVVRVRRGDRLLLGRGGGHGRRSPSLERSPRRAIRANGSDADRDLVGPAGPLRGRHRHHRRPPGATPRRCDGDDPHPGAEPPHPDRLTIRLRDTGSAPGLALSWHPFRSRQRGHEGSRLAGGGSGKWLVRRAGVGL